MNCWIWTIFCPPKRQKALNVNEENFFTRAETPEDIIRTLIWYDWEHDCGGSVPIDAILLFDNFEEVEILLKEWYSQKEKFSVYYTFVLNRWEVKV